MPAVEYHSVVESILTPSVVQGYLESLFRVPVQVLGLAALGGVHASDLKGYGYGTPVKVDYERAGVRCSAVLETVAPGRFGHEHMSDRARILLWSHAANNRLPLHARSLDVGAFRRAGALTSLGDVDELFILNEYVTGEGYYRDLERLRDSGDLRDLDLARSDALCDYLIGIHRVRGPNPDLYGRRLRELVGDHECIAGILDSYPPTFDGLNAAWLQSVEHECVRWRWRLKPLTDRLAQVHGDFHPWNILFQNGVEFAVIDRSRGEWGDPADDVACLIVNYLFFALQRSDRLDGPFEALFTRFWQRYVEGSGDRELASVIAPFFAFRGLVLASPVWYPGLQPRIRRQLLNFVRAVLCAQTFDPPRINEYCDG
jgi:Phosphotransferase enzyme family